MWGFCCILIIGWYFNSSTCPHCPSVSLLTLYRIQYVGPHGMKFFQIKSNKVCKERERRERWMEKDTPLLESWLLIYDAILIFYIHDNILIKYVVNFMKWLKISCWDFFFLHILSDCCRLFQSLQVVRKIWASFLFSCFISNSVIHKLLLVGKKETDSLGCHYKFGRF